MSDPCPDVPDDDPPPLEPRRPEDYECCGNGCEPCIFDLHAQAQDRWRQQMKAWRERQAARASTPAPAPALPAAQDPHLPALFKASDPRENPRPGPADA